MEQKKPDPSLAILKLLRSRGEQDLDEIADPLNLPKRLVRHACDAPEEAGLVIGIHGMGGDENPDYSITDRGKAYLERKDR